MTIFQEFEQKVPWGAQHDAFRAEIEQKVTPAAYLAWRRGDYEPQELRREWLNDIFEKYTYTHERPYQV